MSRASVLELLIIAAATLIATLVLGRLMIPQLKRLRAGQVVRTDGPQSHLKKSGTPTFGGLIFLIPLLVVGIYGLAAGPQRRECAVLALLAVGFAIIGFLDDYVKIRISRKGLSVRQKTVLTGIASIAFAVYYLFLSPTAPFLLLPLSGRMLPIVGWWRLPYLLFIVLVLFFTTHSVNLTDGVDGLCASVTILSMLGLAAAGLLLGFSTVPFGASVVMAVATAAACLGYLFYNRHPARVMMGDTGSLALGSLFSGIALLYGAPWLILFCGVIYMAESLSVMIQVAYFRRTGGKRIFRMSPIHHHFELGGWSENRVVAIFSLITVAGCLAGLVLLL